MIVFALDHLDTINAILAVDNPNPEEAKKTAQIYFQGAGHQYHKLRTEQDLTEAFRDHPTGVIIVTRIKTQQREVIVDNGSRVKMDVSEVRDSPCFR